MMNYLSQQPGQQAIVDALRGTSAGSVSQMPGRTSSLSNSMTPPPQFQKDGGIPPEALEAAKQGGQWVKDNYFTDNSAVGQYGPEAVKMGGQTEATTNGGFGGMYNDAMKAVEGLPIGGVLDAFKKMPTGAGQLFDKMGGAGLLSLFGR